MYYVSIPAVLVKPRELGRGCCSTYFQSVLFAAEVQRYWL
jgi:hypothetical protein